MLCLQMVWGNSSGLLDVQSAMNSEPIEAGPPPECISGAKRRKRKRAAGALLKKFNGNFICLFFKK